MSSKFKSIDRPSSDLEVTQQQYKPTFDLRISQLESENSINQKPKKKVQNIPRKGMDNEEDDFQENRSKYCNDPLMMVDLRQKLFQRNTNDEENLVSKPKVPLVPMVEEGYNSDETPLIRTKTLRMGPSDSEVLAAKSGHDDDVSASIQPDVVVSDSVKELVDNAAGVDDVSDQIQDLMENDDAGDADSDNPRI